MSRRTDKAFSPPRRKHNGSYRGSDQDDSEEDEEKPSRAHGTGSPAHPISLLNSSNASEGTTVLDVTGSPSPLTPNKSPQKSPGRTRSDNSTLSPGSGKTLPQYATRSQDRSPVSPRTATPKVATPKSHLYPDLSLLDDSPEAIIPEALPCRPKPRDPLRHRSGATFGFAAQLPDEDVSFTKLRSNRIASPSFDRYNERRTSDDFSDFETHDRPRRKISSSKANNEIFGNVVTVLTGSSLPQICLSCIILVLLFVFMLLPNLQSQFSSSSQDTVISRFRAEVKTLKESFPAQSNRFWSTVVSQVTRVMKDHPTYPACLILGSQSADHHTAACLSRHLANAIHTAYQRNYDDFESGIIDVERHLGKFAEAGGKELLDDNLQNYYNLQKRAVSVILNLQSLPPATASMLHAYCDNENAPYKNVTILTTVQMSSPANANSIEDVLGDAWSELGNDKLPALLSRVANNIAIVTSEQGQSQC